MKTRESWADIAKGIGILLVVLGHIKYTCEPLKIWLYTFHMPLFFFISGYFVHKKESLKLDIMHKAYILLLPYLILTLLIFILDYILCAMIGQTTDSFTYSHTLGIVMQLPPPSKYESPFWFFSCLFITSSILLILIYAFKDNEKKIMMATCILSIIGLVFIELLKIKLIWNFDLALILLLFESLGYYIKKKELLKNFNKKSLKYKVLYTIIFYVVGLLFCYINFKISNKRIDYYMRQINEPISCYLTGIFNIIFIVMLSNTISYCKEHYNKKKLDILEFLGRNSSVYYVLTSWGIHIGYVIIILMNINISKFKFIDTLISFVIAILVSTPFVTLLSSCLPELFKKDIVNIKNNNEGAKSK